MATTKHTLRLIEPLGVKVLPVSSRLVRSLPHPGRTASLASVRFTPDGKLFAAGYPSGIVQIFDLLRGKEVQRINSPPGYRGSSQYALTDDAFQRLLVPVEGRKVIRLSEEKKRYRIEYTGSVLVWDLATGKPLPSLKPEVGRGVVMAYLSADGRRLVTVERAGHSDGEEPGDDLVRMIDPSTGKAWKLGEGFAMADFSRDGQQVVVTLSRHSGGRNDEVKLFDREGKELATLARSKEERFTWPLISPDGKRLAVQRSKGRINEPGTILLFDLEKRRALASFATGGNYPFLPTTFSPDGRLLAAGDYGGQVSVWDVRKAARILHHRLKGRGIGLTLAFDPAGRRLAVPARVTAGEERQRDPDPRDLPQPRVYLFDLKGGGSPEELVCPHGWAGAVAFSADGKTLAAGGAGAIHLFDVARPAR